MKTKNYFKNNKDYLINKLKKYKLITSNEKLLPNGNTEFLLELSNELEVGDRMTINELAKIVNNLSNTVNGLAITVDGLAIEMREGFKQVNKRLDQHDAKFDDMKQYMDTRFDKIEQRLDGHDAIFKRNNLK